MVKFIPFDNIFEIQCRSCFAQNEAVDCHSYKPPTQQPLFLNKQPQRLIGHLQ